MKKMMKRFLAALLALSIGLTAYVQAAAEPWMVHAESPNVTSMEERQRELEKERIKAMQQSSPLYGELIKNSGEPAPITDLSEESADWVDEYKKKVAEQGVNDVMDAEKDAAKDRIKHLYRRSKHYYDDKKVLESVANTLENIGSFMGLADAVSKFPEVLNLQGDTVEEQLMELVVLTAQFGIAAFSVIGMSIGFPWGLILGVLLEFLLDLIREGVFDGIFPSGELAEDDFDMRRYRLPDGTNVMKPNIYVYSQEKRDVSVVFEEPELLTVTIPEYGDGWQVTADAAGLLTDASGESYEFLFYESVSEPFFFETEEGWRIPADARQERFEEILAGLGFQEREKNDFIEFWTEKLEPDTDYLMYPQGTERVDLAMPVTVTEEPECMERIWFVFVEDRGQGAEEPLGYELTRGGEDCAYYVLEWGGLIL